MTRDFAKVSSQDVAPLAEARAPSREGPSVIGRMLLVLTLVAVVAAAFVGGYYLGQQHGIDQQKVAEKLKLQQQVAAQHREINRLKQALAAKPAPKPKPSTAITEVGELTFYDDLVNDGVNPVAASPAAKASSKLEKNVADIIAQSQQPGDAQLPIYIQLGAYSDEGVAKGVKQRVVALGMISFVQPVTLSGGRHRFRVRVGPYPDMQQAVAAQATLRKKLHMEGIITRAKKP